MEAHSINQVDEETAEELTPFKVSVHSWFSCLQFRRGVQTDRHWIDTGHSTHSEAKTCAKGFCRSLWSEEYVHLSIP